MHETALMQTLIETVLQAAADHNVARVNRVVMSVGKLANVLPDALNFAFEALTQEGIMKGAELEIKHVPATARCESCGHEYRAAEFPILCPLCGSRNFVITGGEEVYIESIDCMDHNQDCEGKKDDEIGS